MGSCKALAPTAAWVHFAPRARGGREAQRAKAVVAVEGPQRDPGDPLDDEDRHHQEGHQRPGEAPDGGDTEGVTLILTGNLHSRTHRGRPGDLDYEPMGFLLSGILAPGRVVSLDQAHGGGTAWICSPGCGVAQLGGRRQGDRPGRVGKRHRDHREAGRVEVDGAGLGLVSQAVAVVHDRPHPAPAAGQVGEGDEDVEGGEGAGLAADHGLELADEQRVGMGPHGAAEHVGGHLAHHRLRSGELSVEEFFHPLQTIEHRAENLSNLACLPERAH